MGIRKQPTFICDECYKMIDGSAFFELQVSDHANLQISLDDPAVKCYHRECVVPVAASSTPRKASQVIPKTKNIEKPRENDDTVATINEAEELEEDEKRDTEAIMKAMDEKAKEQRRLLRGKELPETSTRLEDLL